MSAANTFTTTTLSMPIPRVTSGATSATIMEFLYIDIDDGGTTDMSTTGDAIELGFSIGAPPTAAVPSITSSTTIQTYSKRIVGAAGSMVANEYPYRINLQDANGYGFLVAADTLNVSADSTGMGLPIVWNFRIYYRFVTIPISEYVGIVSSLMT